MPVRSTAGYAGHIFHVMNRAIQGQVLFATSEEYLRFVCTLQQARVKAPIRVLAYCVMPNHWHLLLWPAADADMPEFTQWLCGTHGRRHRRFTGTSGRGAVYQGRYKAVRVNDEAALFRVLRYIERNPVRAALVDRCEQWLWSSASANHTTRMPVDSGPVARPPHWSSVVNDEEPAIELDDIRARIAQGLPIGDPVVSTGGA